MVYLKNIEASCAGCGQCALVCESDAIVMEWGTVKIDEELCILCETCIDYCPVSALVLVQGGKV